MAEEQVTSPDQHKRMNLKGWRIAGVISALAILSMLVGNNHEGWVEDVYVVVVAGLLLALVAGDIVLRRVGLRR